MSTVAADWHSKTMAADSRMASGDGFYFFGIKIHRLEVRGLEALVGVAGCVTNGLRFVEWYGRGCPREERSEFMSIAEDDWFHALVMDRTGLWHFDADLMPLRIEDGQHAVGTGAMIAIAGLRYGMDPREAVELACLGDAASAAPVQSERLTV